MPESGMDNLILRAALEYAELGLQVVKLYGVQTGGACGCVKASKCQTPGKHPNMGKNWQQGATGNEETIARWWEHDSWANVGVLMGPRSGIVDVEFDDEEGRRTAEKYLGECYTPTYRSGRSVHRLFRFDQAFASATVEKIMGLEFRIGSPKACQSVMPPSIHWTGRKYEWLPGLSHLDVEFASLPDGIEAILMNVEDADTRDASTSRRKLYSQTQIVETLDGRDTTIHAEACGLWRERVMAYGPTAVESHEHQSRVYQLLSALNQMKCRPPLPEDVIQQKCEGARKFIAAQASEEKSSERGLTALGLELRGGEWLPGQWFVEVMESDPPMVKLFAPFLPKKFVQLSMEDYDAANKVHLAVLKDTGTVCLADRPGAWPGIWNGHKDSEGEIHVGLKAKLLNAAKITAGPVELKRRTSVAEFVFGWLERANTITGENGLGNLSRPFRDGDGVLWFRFSELFKQAQLERTEFTRLDLSRALRGAGAKEDWFATKAGRKKLMRFEKSGFDKLEGMAFHADEVAGQTQLADKLPDSASNNAEKT